MKKLANFTPDLVTKGIAAGLHPQYAPLWADGREVVFTGGRVSSIQPRALLMQAGAELLDMAQSFTLARQRLYVATTAGVERYIGPQTNPADGQPPAASTQTLLSRACTYGLIEAWGDYVLYTDNVNPIQYDKNTGTLTDLANAVAAFGTAKIIKKYQSHLFAGLTAGFGRRVFWSALDDPETWAASPANDAGSVALRDLDSQMRAYVDIGQNLAVYSQDKMALFRYVGGAFVFANQIVLNGVGALNPRSIVSHNRFNWGLTSRGIFKTDGVELAYVDDPAMRKWIQANVDFAQYAKIYGWHDELNQMICFAVPLIGASSVALCYHYNLQAFTLCHEGVGIGQEAQIFDGVLVSFGTSIYQMGSGTQPASWLETKPMDLGSRELEKKWQMIRLDGTFGEGTEVSLAFMDESDDTAVYEETYPAATVIHLNDGGRTSNQLKMKISAPEGVAWDLAGFELHGEDTGFFK